METADEFPAVASSALVLLLVTLVLPKRELSKAHDADNEP